MQHRSNHEAEDGIETVRLATSNIRGLTLLQRMHSGDRPLGMYVTSTDATTTEIFGLAGSDFVVVDAEHGPLDRTHVLGHVRAAEASGTIPLVRVIEDSRSLIQSMLEVGACGVIVPHVESAEQAERVVAATRFAPSGDRGACAICHSGSYGLADWTEVCSHANESVLAIPLIESTRGVEAAPEIFRVPGVEVAFFGPGDLSTELGMPQMTVFDAPPLLEAWESVSAAAMEAGVCLVVPDTFAAGAEQAHALTVGGDMSLLARTVRQRLHQAREELR